MNSKSAITRRIAALLAALPLLALAGCAIEAARPITDRGDEPTIELTAPRAATAMPVNSSAAGDPGAGRAQLDLDLTSPGDRLDCDSACDANCLRHNFCDGACAGLGGRCVCFGSPPCP
jgi:hypothetical protein